jgi:hypothetical protein
VKRKYPKLTSWDYIEIEWSDCTFRQDGWEIVDSLDFEEQLAYSKGFITVGLFIRQDKDNIYISHTTNTCQDSVLGFLSIPKGSITKIRKLNK